MLDYAMRQAIGKDDQEIGFKLDQKRSRRHIPEITIDLNFADDITLVTEKIEHVQHNAAKIGLHLNADKTEFMSFNQEQKF